MRASDRQKIKHGMLNTFSHELTHIAEVSGFYDELHSAIVSALEKRGISFNELVEKKKEQLRNNLKAKPIGDEELTYLADVEVIADSCETMLKNSKIFEDIAQSNPNLAQKLKNKLKNFIARLKQLLSKIDALTPEGKLLEECVTDFENIQKLWDKAVTDGIKTINAINAEQKNNTAVDSDAKYSIRYTKENKPVVVVEENILQGIPKKQWVKTVKNVMSEKFSDGIPVKGRFIKVNRISRNEYTNSKNTKYLRDTKGNIYVDKLKTANNLDEIILASTNYINEDLKHKRKDGFKEFARGEVLLKIGENEYKSNVIIGYNSANEMVLYDIIDFIPAKFALKKESTPYGRKPIRNGMLSNDNIPQTNGNVNIQSMQEDEKYSMRDSVYLEAANNNDIQYQARNIDDNIDYSDLTSLDDEERTVYNKRGWAYQLFTAEDYKLLNEKFNEKYNLYKNQNDFVLGDGSRVVEVNNKLVLIGGSFKNPQIHYVLAINARNETDAELLKECVINVDSEARKYNKETFKDICRITQEVYGDEFICTNDADDFVYHKGQVDTGIRAKIPESFKNYGYTKQFQNRGRDNSEAEQGVSDNGVNTDFPQFQMRPDNGFANRRMLANALENSVQDNYEKKLLNLYKDNIDQIDELEARLDEVNQKIKKASSVKAADRNREQRTELVKLNNVKKILEDKITRKDKQLLNLESMKPMQKLVETEKKKAYHKARISYEAQLKEVREKRDQAKFRLYFKSA